MLTVLLSTSLAGIFIVCFVRETRRGASPERDSLLPLDDPADFAKGKKSCDYGK